MPIRSKSKHNCRNCRNKKSKNKSRNKSKRKRSLRRYKGAGLPVSTTAAIPAAITTRPLSIGIVQNPRPPPSDSFNIARTTLQSQIDPDRLGNVLKLVCNNSDNCLALGPYGDAIKQYFTNFADLRLIRNDSLTRIGSDSANGVVIETPFTKGAYTAYTALKCSKKASADNLFYEYYIGHTYINTHIAYLPCFVETYGCYTFKNIQEWTRMQTYYTSNNFDGCDFQSMLEPMSLHSGAKMINMLENSCLKNKLLCVLIQHFDNVRSFYSETFHHPENITVDFYNLLYQIYYGLTLLGNTYTHYDLHGSNVLLYKPYEGQQYITMRYHRDGHIYEFKTEYICKIIDYGRNFMQIPHIKTATTANVINLICRQPACQPDCGYQVGYKMIQGNAFTPQRNPSYILPNIPNMSHDLRLITNYIALLTEPTQAPFVKVFDNLTYVDKYGTPENTTGNIDNITTIFHLRDALERVMGNESVAGFNAMHNDSKYATWTQAAIMNIYDDDVHSDHRRPYTYTII